MSKKIIRICLLMLLLVCLMATAAFADNTTRGGASVTADSLNLRSGAGTNTDVVTVLPKDSFLLVTDQVGIWYKVLYNGMEGYVSSYFVNFADTMEGSYGIKGVIDGSSVRLRSGASTSTQVLGYFNTGDEMDVLGVSGAWIKVKTSGGSLGYVHSDYINCLGQQEEDAEYITVGTIKGSGVRMRAGASTNTAILGHYNTGARFTVIGTEGLWKQVKTASGVTGYIHGDYLVITTEKVESDGTTSPSTLGEQIVASAKQYLGVPYVWAGMSPSGFDCSGFVNYVYKLYDVSLWRVAQDIYSKNGVFVDKANLQPGDIIAFGYGPYNITHVGIYIGGGQFIHASSGSGYVTITDLSTNYYTNMYVGAKRVIE